MPPEMSPPTRPWYNIAETEGRYAVKVDVRRHKWPLNYRNMSTVMFFYPAVAAVGINEKHCRRSKIPYRVAFYSNALLSRAMAMRATNGFVKIIVTDDDEGKHPGYACRRPPGFQYHHVDRYADGSG